jgi:putative colanic acid biosynthesis acetyltransferase WcaB
MFKSKLIILCYRVGAYLKYKPKIIRILSLPYFVLYKLMTEFFLSLELPLNTQIGPGLTIYHGFGIVINGGTTIGKNCVLRQGVTIGNKLMSDGTESCCPIIGNNVEVGANAIIIGDIIIGDNVKIGAGTVVTKSVNENSVVVSNQMRLI